VRIYCVSSYVQPTRCGPPALELGKVLTSPRPNDFLCYEPFAEVSREACGKETTSKDLGVERIILKWIFEKWDGEAWTGLIWLTIGTDVGLL